MKSLFYVLIGVFFGIVLFKSEAASWFRIYEMFQFDSFHMYGIIGSALVLGVVFTQWVKRPGRKSFFGDPIQIAAKEKSISRYAIGGTIFGLGWALAGACPGPIYVLLGSGFWTILIVFFGTLLGTFAYGLLRNRLPH
ncbi:MAG: YeeE/YedE family protein [Allomuricauda sp.]|nr:MAG: YeeE/YedE family protein [Allomuricauda sp.]